MGYAGVVVLANGTTIGCAPSLGMTHVKGLCGVFCG